jgi:cation diffusion facilitator family transporter
MPALRKRKESEGSTNASGNGNGHAIFGGLMDTESPHGAVAGWGGGDNDDRRMSYAASLLNTPQVRSQRLIGSTNPRYQWEQYWKSDEELAKIKSKSVRKYYERNNYLIQHYLYIDRLLDSSLPHDLIQEYQSPHNRSAVRKGSWQKDLPETIDEIEPEEAGTPPRIYHERAGSADSIFADGGFYADAHPPPQKIKRTKDLYNVKKANTSDENGEQEPLLTGENSEADLESGPRPPDLELEEEASSRIVTVAIIINLIANSLLLVLKIIVVVLSSSVSVLASLVDAALDFLSTAIVGLTTRLISRTDQYAYPIGRRRLEPVGVLVFSVIMITAFIQVLWEAGSKLTSGDQTVVELTVPAIAIMTSTVVIKGACWFWCRLIKNSSVQALAQDAMTDVVFNTFSIIFPLIGYYARIWWLDPVGGIILSLYVIVNWSQTANEHIRNLTGASATADERNILLYLTMRFAKTIKKIQGLQAYHSGDKLNVEVDIVLDEEISLRDSHDLGESLQYVLESVPNGESRPPIFSPSFLRRSPPQLTRAHSRSRICAYGLRRLQYSNPHVSRIMNYHYNLPGLFSFVRCERLQQPPFFPPVPFPLTCRGRCHRCWQSGRVFPETDEGSQLTTSDSRSKSAIPLSAALYLFFFSLILDRGRAITGRIEEWHMHGGFTVLMYSLERGKRQMEKKRDRPKLASMACVFSSTGETIASLNPALPFRAHNVYVREAERATKDAISKEGKEKESSRGSTIPCPCQYRTA